MNIIKLKFKFFMEIAVFAAILVVPFVFSACASDPSDLSEAKFTHIEAEEAEKMISDESAVLIDIRDEPSFDYEHIPGAMHIWYDDGKGIDNFIEKFPDKNQPLLVYCDYGGISKMCAEDLAKNGYKNVYEFDGIEVWTGELEGEAHQ